MVILECALAGRNGQSSPGNIQLFPLQLTTSSRMAEHAVLLYKVRLKRIITEVFKLLVSSSKEGFRAFSVSPTL